MKEFFKQISIYGILPVVGKFAGLLLIPIYTRIFSSAEFGMMELLITLVKFFLFACNLEFYNAIGRFFYEREKIEDKRRLISTGLFLTVGSTTVVATSLFLLQDFIFFRYLESSEYKSEFLLCLVWLIIEAIFIYLSVIPRFQKKPKLYVLISTISLFVRIASTILFVITFGLGIKGVILGHIAGATVSLVLNTVVSREFLGLRVSWGECREIFKYAIPIVPGLLLIGFWSPLSRNLISEYFSLEILGLFAFAIRISSVMEILNGAIRMAWNPLVFEGFQKPNFKRDTQNISRLVGTLAFLGAIGLTLMAPELTFFIGTPEYEQGALLVGFLALTGITEILKRLRGFGPLIQKKTFLLTVAEAVGIFTGIFLLINLNKFGLIGLGIAFLLPAVIKYFILSVYTARSLDIQLQHKEEIFLFIAALFSIFAVYSEYSFMIRSLILLIVLGLCTFSVKDFILVEVRKRKRTKL